MALLLRGFSAITPGEEQSLRDKWMGTPLYRTPYVRYLAYTLLAGSLLGVLLIAWVMSLRRIVRQRTAKLEATLDAVPDLMFELGLDGRYHDCHSRRPELLAAPADTLPGRRVTDVLPPAAAASCLSALHEANETGYSVGQQFELMLDHGRFCFELSVARKPTGSGEEPRFIVLSRDVTARKQTEAALLRRSEQLELMSLASQRINSELDIPAVLRHLVAAALQLTGAAAGTAARVCAGQMVFSEYNEGGQLTPVDYRFDPGYGVPGQVMKTCKSHLSNDAEHDPFVIPGIRQALGFTNLLDTPIIGRHGQLLGCFEIHNKPGGFDDSDVHLLQGLAASAAVALENGALLAERQRAEQALRESEALQASVLASAACGIIATDPQGLITVFNPVAEAIFGYRADEVVGKLTPLIFHDPADVLAMARARSEELGCAPAVSFDTLVAKARTSGQVDEREAPCVRKDGRRITVRLAVTVLRSASGVLAGYLGTVVDISQHKAAEARIQRLAHFDSLTELPNRALLEERFRHDLSRAQRGRESLALIFLDLDRFKQVNDSLGHRIGDQLLVEVAGRLQGAVRDEDTLCRLGGDEFIVVLPNTDADGAAHVASKLLEVSASPYHLEEHELHCTLSLGIALYPVDGDNLEALSICADTAMYRAKQGGRNGFCFFTPEMQERSARALQLENDLRRALARKELELFYEPQLALADRRLLAAEALLRWHHPQLGMVPPAEFVPIAEESGLLLPIGEWVLRSAVRQMRVWHEAGLPPIPVAVSLSTGQLRQTRLAQLVSRILADEALPAQYLELELTESLAMDNPLAVIGTVGELCALGVRIVIDDFGSGYSSMSHLTRLRAHKLKIHRSLVADLAVDPDAEAIVAAVISLAHRLGLRVVGEGVESEAQVARLRENGCDDGQGYLFSQPLAAAQFEALVRERYMD